MAGVGGTFGVPTQLNQGSLPTKISVYNHALYTRKVKEGSLRHNTSVTDLVKIVTEDIKVLWDKTDIPNLFNIDPEKAERKVNEVLKASKKLAKVPVCRRKEDFAGDLDILLDLSLCQHESIASCVCPAAEKVNSILHVQIVLTFKYSRFLLHGLNF